ncbi:MAG TPA: TRAP transporter TatT component family protein [Bdellovibrionota bacterium]|jgi:hypothetical protein|nr:TRAP transporter TatT component family protein [Bdellovibrionota bacterium]
MILPSGRARRVLGLLVLLALLGSTAMAYDRAAPGGSPPPADVFDEGDALFQDRGNEAKALKALEIYRDKLRQMPGNPQAGWRVAMGCYFVGLRIEKDSDKKKALYDEGRHAGVAAAKALPGCAPCHFWAAITLALYGDAVGVFKMLFTLGEIRDHLKATQAIDPAYAHGGAQRLLGLIEKKLPGILGGSNDRARDYFKNAIQTAPDEPLNYLFLAQLQEDQFDDLKGALETARKGAALPMPSADRLESVESLQQVKDLVAELEKKLEKKKK